MAKYKCTGSFRSAKGKNYSYSDRIDSYEYDGLSTKEQGNFSRDDDDDSLFGMGRIGSIAMGDMLGTGMPGGLDGDLSTLL